MVVLVACPRSSKGQLPYILDLLPHLQLGDVDPTRSFKTFLHRWGAVNKPHFIADAAFASDELCNHILSWGGNITFSWNVGHTPWLWELLSYNLPPYHWRVAFNSRLNSVASLHAIINDKGKKAFQQIISTGYSMPREEEEQDEKEESEVERENSEEENEEINDDFEEDSFFTEEIHTDNSEQEQPVPIQRTTMPVFTEEELQTQTVKELKEICRTYHLRIGKRKQDIIESILRRSATMNQEYFKVDAVEHSIATSYLSDPAPLHDRYKRYFNAVDLINRRWNAVEEHHHHHSWKTKMVLIILRLATYNAWVYHSQLQWRGWKQWRKELIRGMLESN